MLIHRLVGCRMFSLLVRWLFKYNLAETLRNERAIDAGVGTFETCDDIGSLLLRILICFELKLAGARQSSVKTSDETDAVKTTSPVPRYSIDKAL